MKSMGVGSGMEKGKAVIRQWVFETEVLEEIQLQVATR